MYSGVFMSNLVYSENSHRKGIKTCFHVTKNSIKIGIQVLLDSFPIVFMCKSSIFFLQVPSKVPQNFQSPKKTPLFPPIQSNQSNRCKKNSIKKNSKNFPFLNGKISIDSISCEFLLLLSAIKGD